MKIELEITKITIVKRYMDRVYIETNFPSPTPKVDDAPLSFSFDCAKDTGEEYVKKNFNIEPEIIDALPIQLKFSKLRG